MSIGGLYGGDSPTIHDVGALEDRVVAYLLDEGPQSTCQISVALGESLSAVATALKSLEHDGRRIRRQDLPPQLRRYQILDANRQPVIYLYEAVCDPADSRPRLVYTL